MGLLSEILEHLRADSDIMVGGPKQNPQLTSYPSIDIAVVPTTMKSNSELIQLFYRLLPQEPFRVYDFFGLAKLEWCYGELLFKETVGSEIIFRSFSVDDAGLGLGKCLAVGDQPPITRPLERNIIVTLYPRTAHNLRFKFGRAA